jgi:hypothetical protein
MALQWISNVFLDRPATPAYGQSLQDAEWQRAEWLKDKILGEPSEHAKGIPGARGVYVQVEEDGEAES